MSESYVKMIDIPETVAERAKKLGLQSPTGICILPTNFFEAV